MLIGAQGYTIRDFAKSEQEIETSLKRLNEIGFKYLQMSAFAQIPPERLKELIDEYSIEIVVTHTNPDRILNDLQNVINEHKIFGCSHIGIGSMPVKYLGSIDGAKQFVNDFDLAAKTLKENGMKLHYHNHAFEYEKFDGVKVIDVMLDMMPSDLWGFILDVYWVQYAGVCPAKQIEALKGRIDFCHFKDMEIVDNKQQMSPVMSGNLCFEEIIEACESTGVKYAMIEQDDTYGKNPFEELKISFKNLMGAGCKY